MRRRALLVPVLLLSLVPAASASACHGGQHYVDTLALALPAPPATHRPGSVARVPVDVTRAAAPAGGVDVYLRLQHGPDLDDVTYSSARTELDGRADLQTVVPHDARGALRVTVEAFSEVVTIPCYGPVVEHGLAEASWGRVAR